ncbi:MAG: DUF1786 domain-containing protein [Chloroflexi bacterium]|nr:DUF1786 domain-containing protein [Chloroflexota bacterium]
MRILTIDVGTGTQDILLYDSEREIENSIKLVMPSPTAVVARQIRAATELGTPLLLDGVTMGGGPSHWAARDHALAGHAVYATPDAARTFDDDLDAVRSMGITVVSEDEAAGLRGVERVTLRDLWVDAVRTALRAFGADDRFDRLAVAVFDHGAAPPGYSDRTFRFEYLAERVRQSADLTVFAFPHDRIPASLTRLAAVAASIGHEMPLLVMDTAPAAVLGALEDPAVSARRDAIVANVGNFHCLAFRLEGGQVAGLFEHHTGELTQPELEAYLDKLIAGTITNQEVFDDMGHGALMFQPPAALPDPFVAITGPRRGLLRGSRHRPYLAVPHGDMMLAGCFGLLRAYAANDAEVRAAVEAQLGPRPEGVARPG